MIPPVPSDELAAKVVREMRANGHKVRASGQVFECSCGLVESMEVITAHCAEIDARAAIAAVLGSGGVCEACDGQGRVALVEYGVLKSANARCPACSGTGRTPRTAFLREELDEYGTPADEAIAAARRFNDVVTERNDAKNRIAVLEKALRRIMELAEDGWLGSEHSSLADQIRTLLAGEPQEDA